MADEKAKTPVVKSKKNVEEELYLKSIKYEKDSAVVAFNRPPYYPFGFYKK